MIRMLRKTWPWAVALAVFFLLPWPLQPLMGADAAQWKGLVFTFLVALNPAACLLAGVLAGYRHGFAWVLAALTFVAWLPATFVLYNETALVYGVFYALVCLAGLGLGVGLRSLGARRPRPVTGR